MKQIVDILKEPLDIQSPQTPAGDEGESKSAGEGRMRKEAALDELDDLVLSIDYARGKRRGCCCPRRCYVMLTS